MPVSRYDRLPERQYGEPSELNPVNWTQWIHATELEKSNQNIAFNSNKCPVPIASKWGQVM